MQGVEPGLRARRLRWSAACGTLGLCALTLGAGLARRCPAGEWSRPVEIWPGEPAAAGDTIQIDFRPALAAGADGAYAVATLGTSMARLAPRPLLATRIGGGSLGIPDGGATFFHPRAAVDASGTLHMIWGEPHSQAPAVPPGAPGRPRLNRLMYARHSAEGWSAAETVYTGMPLWHAANNSDLLVDEHGALHVAFTAIRPGAGPVLVHLRSSPAGWGARDVGADPAFAQGPARGAAYPRLALGEGGRVYLAFVAALATESGPRVPNANSVFVARSQDGGATWSTPALVSYSGQDQASDPQLLTGAGDTLHLLWGKNLHGGIWAEVVWHALSPDGGATWTAPMETRVQGHTGQLHNVRAVMNASKQLHLAFRASGQGLTDDPRAGIYYARWSGAWTEPQRLDFASRSSGFDFAADPRGRLHLLWQTTGPAGLRSLLHAVHPPCERSNDGGAGDR